MKEVIKFIEQNWEQFKQYLVSDKGYEEEDTEQVASDILDELEACDE